MSDEEVTLALSWPDSGGDWLAGKDQVRMSAHLKFVELGAAAKTRRVGVFGARGDALLGRISWFGAWRRYVFYPHSNTAFDPSCLRAIAVRVEQMTAEHKAAKNEAAGPG